MTNLETNTTARRVEPITTDRWIAVSPEGEMLESSLSTTKEGAEKWCDLIGYTTRKVKLTIEVVE